MGNMSPGVLTLKRESCTARVMTFNLRRAAVWDGRNAWRYRKKRVAEAIVAAEPDFVGTQESLRTMLLELGVLLPGCGWIGEGRKVGGADEMNAILYRKDRWEPEESGTFWLSETPELPGSRGWGAVLPRICTWGLFRRLDDPGARIAIFNTHLDHISPKARTCGAALAARRMQALQQRVNAPAVLMGDFNAKPRSEAIRALCEQFGLLSAYSACPGGAETVGATYHGFRGGGRKGSPIDYIFACGASCTFEQPVVDRNPYLGAYPSDHYPVVADMTWQVLS